MNSSLFTVSTSRRMRAATILLAAGGSLIFLTPTAFAQVKAGGTVSKTPITTTKTTGLTAADLDMTDACLKQIMALEADKEKRTPAQQKIDSQLLYAAKMDRNEPIADGVQRLNVGLTRDASRRALVDLRCTVSDALINSIKVGGGTVIEALPEYNHIRAWISVLAVESFAERSDVITIRAAVPPKRDAGSVDGQGDTTHAANGSTGARAVYGTDGTGLLVGVLSDDDLKLTNSQATGDLPPATGAEPTSQDLPGKGAPTTSGYQGTAEGTAMMEIVHDVAPGAGIRFATAFQSEASFAANIRALATAGCKIIVDDVSYFDEPPFQDGIVAKAVDDVTSQGVLYFSSAGNEGNKAWPGFGGSYKADTSSVWEGNFSDGGTVSLTSGGAGATFAGGHVHLFNSTAYNTVNRSVGPLALYWSDKQGASANDYDLYVASGTTVAVASTTTQNGTQDPIELLNYTIPAGYRVYVFAKNNASARMLHLNGSSSYIGGTSAFAFTTNGQTHGHSQARNAFCVAAAPATNDYGYGGPYSGLFTATSPNEYFTSDGPRRVFYDNAGNLINTSNTSLLADGGELRLKPELTAADGVTSSAAFSSSSGLNPFYGTSAAAPHAAAIAALVKTFKSANATAAAAVPTGLTIDGSQFTLAEMRTILINGCIDNTFGNNGVGWDQTTGYGILMPKKALQFVTSFCNANTINLASTNTTATVSWTTNLTADSVVEYGTTSGVYTNSASGASATSHSVVLSGLSPSTAYYYRIKSMTGATEASSGASYISPERTFVTSASAASPTISISGCTVDKTSGTVTVTLANNGTAAANSARVTSATLTGATSTTSFPTSATNIAINGSTGVTLTFTGITTGTKTLKVVGSYNGGGFSVSLRITVP